MLLCANGGLQAIRVSRPQHLTTSGKEFAPIRTQTNIILLIHSLQLGMEATYHHILETIALYLRPVLYFIRGDILRITSHIVRRIGIRSLSADSRHQFVVLIGNKVLCSHLRHTIDFMIGLLTCFKVCKSAIGFIALLDLPQQRCLCLRIARTELFRTLKHQMLQIVCQACSLCRIVL